MMVSKLDQKEELFWSFDEEQDFNNNSFGSRILGDSKKNISLIERQQNDDSSFLENI